MKQYRCETLTPKYEYGNSVEERSYDLQTRKPYLHSRTLHRIDESQRGGSGTPTPCSVGCPRRRGLAMDVMAVAELLAVFVARVPKADLALAAIKLVKFQGEASASCRRLCV